MNFLTSLKISPIKKKSTHYSKNIFAAITLLATGDVKENLSFISFSEVLIDERSKNCRFALEMKSRITIG